MTECTLIEDSNAPGQYRVEAFDDEGTLELTVFSGPEALARAIHFAAASGEPYYDRWNDPQALGGI